MSTLPQNLLHLLAIRRGLSTNIDPTQSAIITADCGVVTIGELARLGADLRELHSRGQPLTLVSPTTLTLASHFVGLQGWASSVTVGAHNEHEPSANGDDSAGLMTAQGSSHETTWRLFSSGTTNVPTITEHTLFSLVRGIRTNNIVEPSRRRVWGLLYPPYRMAGMQVILHSIFGGGLVVDAAPLTKLTDQLDFFANQGVNALSATPTRWRAILREPKSAELKLDQITLGGEIADQKLLDGLQQRFPAARVTHVYASTEAGVSFAVHDGRSGFPKSLLQQEGGSGSLVVRNNVLYVYAPETSAAEKDGFVRTGDLVVVQDERVHFDGRESSVINVGGVKVSPERVESVLMMHPSVEQAVVRGRRNSFSGWVVEADVVPIKGLPLEMVEELPGLLRGWTLKHLARPNVPARIVLVSDLPITSLGKATRR